MATWATSLPYLSYAVGYSGELIHNTVRTPFEAGYVGTRPRFTRGRRAFRCGWSALPSSHFNTFMDFVSTCLGGADTFTWTDYKHDSTGTAYTVRFRDDSIDWDLVDAQRFRVSFQLEEV